MKLTKRTIIFIIGGAILATGVAACNYGMRFSGPEERSEWMMHKITKELELNETQQARLENVKDELLKARKTMHENREQHSSDIIAMLKQPTFDRDKANTIVSQHIETVNTQAPVIIDAIGDFYDSLDDAQRARLREFIEHKMDHHHDRRHW
jgi:Spy/CpxP family protein refolding chaperone